VNYFSLGAATAAIVISTLAGCGPKLVARPITAKTKEAMPYYLPRPHLLVTRNFNAVKVTKTTVKETTGGTTKETTTETSEPTKVAASNSTPVYAYQIVYLPDRSEKHGLSIKRGIGTLDSKITLTDGWRFTGTEVKTDSKTPETIQAVANLIKESAGAAAALGGAPAVPAGNMAIFNLGSDDKLKRPDADIALYDLFTGRCVFSWPATKDCSPATD